MAEDLEEKKMRLSLMEDSLLKETFWMGYSISKLDNIFLTHLHADHAVEYVTTELWQILGAVC